jgi:hypothetical protein
MSDGYFGGAWRSGVNCYCYAVHHKALEGGIKLEPGALSGDEWSRPRDPAHFWALVQRDGAIPVNPSFTATPAGMPPRQSNPGHYLIAMKLNSWGMVNYHALRRDESTGEWWQTALGFSMFTDQAVIFKDNRITTPHTDEWTDARLRSLQPLDLWIGYFWIPNAGLQGPPARKRGGCCFITTATCESRGLPDDCEELEQLRWFRDNVMLGSVDGRNEVQEYYSRAPALLTAIRARPDSAAIFARMYETGIRPAVQAIKHGDYAKAHDIYRREVEELERLLVQDEEGGSCTAASPTTES